MKRRTLARIVAPFAASGFALALALPAAAHDNHYKANLDGFEEVPAVLSPAVGKFTARLNKAGTELAYELRYEDFANTVTQAHIHFAQKGVNGGIVVFLCSNLGNGPAGTPACPPGSATLTGTIAAADMVNTAAAQGLAAGDFDGLVEALREGVAYVNVHSDARPGGEIRGQLK